MHLYFLLAAVFSTVILGSPVAQDPLPSIQDLSSFVPQDLAPNPNQESSAATLLSQSSNSQTFQDSAVPDQPTWPNPAFDIALAPNNPGEKIDADTAQYRSFDCHQGYSVCCQGWDRSINSQHRPCSEKSGNQYAGFEDVSSAKDVRDGQYCYSPFYTTACDASLWGVLQDVKGMTCYTDCQIPAVEPEKKDGSLGDFQFRRF